MNHESQDNNVTNSKGVIFTKYDIELSRPFGQCVIYDEDEIGQWHDLLYRFALRRKQYWTVMTDSIR